MFIRDLFESVNENNASMKSQLHQYLPIYETLNINHWSIDMKQYKPSKLANYSAIYCKTMRNRQCNIFMDLCFISATIKEWPLEKQIYVVAAMQLEIPKEI